MEEYLFFLPARADARPVCLICNETVAVIKSGNVKRHYVTTHNDFSSKFPPKSSVDVKGHQFLLWHVMNPLISDISQLCIYVRFFNGKEFVEDLLTLLPLDKQSRDEDVFQSLNKFFDENGSPRNQMTMNEIVAASCQEAEVFKKAKFDGIIIENMFDVPWLRPEELGPETVASMTAVASAIRRENPSMPIGIQILSSGNREALAVAKAAGLNFIRAEGWAYAHIGDEGYTQSCAAMVTRYRRHLSADDVLVFTDVKKKHSSHAISADISIASAAEAAELFSSDAIVVTGSSTGVATSLNDLEDVQDATTLPVLVGSGITVDNVEQYIHANGLIVGSHLKFNGHWANEIDIARVEKFMNKINCLRGI